MRLLGIRKIGPLRRGLETVFKKKVSNDQKTKMK